jgi:hypothetical protein
MLKIIKINEVRVMFNEEEHEESKRTLEIHLRVLNVLMARGLITVLWINPPTKQ